VRVRATYGKRRSEAVPTRSRGFAERKHDVGGVTRLVEELHRPMARALDTHCDAVALVEDGGHGGRAATLGW